MAPRFALPLLLPVLLALPARAQPPAGAPAFEVSRRIQAVRTARAPVLDGLLDDAVWASAPRTSDFFQKEPAQGRAASQRTEVAFAYDATALYVAAWMSTDRPEELNAVLTRRDESGTAERLIVSLDTYRDRRTAYSFAVTAPGVRVDWYHPVDDEYRRDSSFNPVWEARTQRTATGWTAELRIPFSQLRFNAGAAQRWGVNVNRYVPGRNEDDFWVVVPREVRAWSSRFGELTGLEDLPASSRVELLPYVAGDARRYSGEDPRAGTPFASERGTRARAGLDAKMGLGPNLTLDATVNPDFGQLEADPAEVNLSGFETFFGERRPFFTEGSQLLTGTSGPGYFYSRRIGASPRLSPDADYVHPVGATTILGASKLTGRLASGLGVGALAALTAEERAGTWDGVERGSVRVAPTTGYGVARVQQEVGRDASVLGATLTGVHRDIAPGDGLVEELARDAVSGGVDWNLRFRGGEYALSGYAGGSRVSGEPAALLRVQESSAHYFQRPDQDYVHVDPDARQLSGYTLGARFDRLNARHWLWGLGASAESPGLELNDVGRLQGADDLDANARLIWRDTEPGRLLRSFESGLYLDNNWNYGGVRQATSLTLTNFLTLPNFWTTYFYGTFNPRALSDTATRGGPLMQRGHAYNVDVGFSSNGALTTQGGLDASVFGGETAAYGFFLGPRIATQVGRHVRLSLEPRLSRYTVRQQYVDTLPGGRAETYGQHYVFAALQRRELSLRLRANVFFTPDLSLEGYAEPFASRGQYAGFGELERPRGRSLRRYGTDGTSLQRQPDGSLEVTDADAGSAFVLEDPDFNLRSFRSNVVLRWEWRRGSSLFVVYQQDRFTDAALGRAASPGALAGALGAPGVHSLTLKLSYWLPVG